MNFEISLSQDSDFELDMLPKRKHSQISVIDDDDDEDEDDVRPSKRIKVSTAIVDLSKFNDDVESPSFSPTKSVKKSTKAVNEKVT